VLVNVDVQVCSSSELLAGREVGRPVGQPRPALGLKRFTYAVQ
jgi:hypothetical protein